MSIVFRVDSSTQIGSGHIMRCLTLAAKIRKLDSKRSIYFITRDLPGNLNKLISDMGYYLLILPLGTMQGLVDYEKWLTVSKEKDADDTVALLQSIPNISLMVIDHYALDAAWEERAQPYVKKIMVIDDLANRPHICNVLLDQTYGMFMDRRYRGLVPIKCKLYTGIEYVLLRDGFYNKHPYAHTRQYVNNILVFFGGSDDTGETKKLLRAISKIKEMPYLVQVVVGSSNVEKDQIKNICSTMPFVKYFCQVPNMEDFIFNADIAFGSPGGNTWERCYLGLPAFVTVTAENQCEIAKQMEMAGTVKSLGWHEDVTIQRYYEALLQLDKLPLARMSQCAFDLIKDSKLDDMLHDILEE